MIKRCFYGYTKDECPKRRLENEKLFFGILLAIAIAVLVACQI